VKYDVIVIGTGIAGLYCAKRLANEGKSVLLISKNEKNDCNTYWAQGGIATALNVDDIADHISDTLSAGAGMCDEDAVKVLVQESLSVVPDLIDLGVPFDRDENGNLLYTKEAAHSANRIIHAGGDATGREIHTTLLHKNESEIMDKSIVVDLLIEGDLCYGVSVLRDNVVRNVYADNVIIASGGLGSLYSLNTNAKGISGDIHGICEYHGCELQDMHLIQFHPTVFVKTSGQRKLLLSEALRGEGAKVVDEDGTRFLFDYNEMGELAPRDAVARAIFMHKQKTGKEVFLDFSDFGTEHFKKRFPTICATLGEEGYDLPRDRVPISPAFHYAMGGIKTDLDSRMIGFKNLFAIGEAASNRVHGANRLASNSLLEGLVFAKIVSEYINRNTFQTEEKSFPEFTRILKKEHDSKIKEELRSLMWENVGIIRRSSGLKEALDKVSHWLETDIGWLMRLRLLTAKAIITAAIEHKVSVGAHYLINE
jgi:L-aspartate oxidase